MRQGMWGPKILLESNGAHGGGHEHVASCPNILAVFVSARQGVHNQVDSFESDAVAQRMKRWRGERFDAVRQRIHARGSSQFRGKLERKFRIQNDQTGQ